MLNCDFGFLSQLITGMWFVLIPQEGKTFSVSLTLRSCLPF